MEEKYLKLFSNFTMKVAFGQVQYKGIIIVVWCNSGAR